MSLKEWAVREGVGYAAARRWFAEGLLPMPARRVGGLITGPAEADGDLVRDVIEILTSLRARLYRRRTAANRAARAVRAITGGVP